MSGERSGFSGKRDNKMEEANLTVTVLVDNRVADKGLVAEHGLSMWIEAEGVRVIFDTGDRRALAPNARTLGIDLTAADALILSHGHFDHTGGLPDLLRQGRGMDVYCHPGVVHPRYSIRNGTARAIHMPSEAMAALDKWPEGHLHWAQRPIKLNDNMGVTGPIGRQTDFEDTGGPFYLDPEGRRPDAIEDDLAMWVATREGLVVVAGCAHAGLVNTLLQVKALNEGVRIRAVLGGFHLMGASRNRIDQTIAAIKKIEPDLVVPCHCTGEDATIVLLQELGERVVPGAAGMTYRF